MALKFVGNGGQFDGPGNVAVDKDGNIWANNNYQKAIKPENVCAGLEVFKVLANQRWGVVRGFTGGGVNGAGFGIGIDTKDRIWVGNFGFTGSKCTVPATANSVSEFRQRGKPVSGPQGYTRFLSWPQGTISDRQGNIWITNCGNDSVVRYGDGKERNATVVSSGVLGAFDVGINSRRQAWVTANSSSKVFAFKNDGTSLSGSPFSSGFNEPKGIVPDSSGNMWVANSGIPAVPCDGNPMPDPPSGLKGSITRLDGAGVPTVLKGGGLTIPWGIVTDGDGNVFVGNFDGQRLSHFCGQRAKTCQKGKRVGEGISPRKLGYGFSGLQRSTGLTVDGSGTVWVTNNWKQIPVQINPGGDGLVAFLGLASPVKTPIIGPPERP